MRPLLVAMLSAAIPFVAPGSEQTPRREIDNVVTFARLYGVVRYFYPSDAAASLEWDRFAVHGVKIVRAARDRKELETSLEALFGPLGPGIEIAAKLPAAPDAGKADSSLIAWRYLGPGVAAPRGFSPYRGKRTNRSAVIGPGVVDGSGTAMQTTSAVPLRGWMVPVHAQVRSTPVTSVELFESPPIEGSHVTFDLGSGLRARVPLALSDLQATASAKPSAKLDTLRTALALVPDLADPPDVDMRLAAVVVAWNVFRHFYPYWAETGVDWDARLASQLQLAYAANARDSQLDALRQLVADARDGHGTVVDTRRKGERARWPVQLRIIDSRVVITASDNAADFPVGAVVSAIDGIPAMERVAAAMRRASGTTQWTRTRALQEITSCEKGAVATLAVDSGTGPRQVSLRCVPARPPAEQRPAAVAELTSGIWYVDLTRAPMAEITPVLETLARARGVVFDVRGYPTDAGAKILPHMIDTAETDRWMHVAKIIGPFGQNAGWQSIGWNLQPYTPRLSGTIVFLTDERAISYAESVMGYVADRKLGTIVGGTTAGTNGNVATFPVPGGFTVAFTGMRVTGHDGQTPFHLVGIKPDISVVPTLAGLRNGRDEVLERALAAIRGK